jgi:acylphosphatase
VPSARLYRVRGRVQGIGFRWFVERVADNLGLAGCVKNLYDGSVEVYALGDDKALDELRQNLERGPLGARVTAVEETPAPLRTGYKGFRIEF